MEPRHARQRHINGLAHPHDPSSSSVIATHLAPTNGHAISLDVDRESFAQLLDESLGTDADGQPNLGNEPAVNQKLIAVIVKAGLEHAVNQPLDPFNENSETSPVHEACRCLDVIKLAVSRSPEVLHQLSGQHEPGPDDSHVPLFMWLIPRLLSVLVRWSPPSHQLQSAIWNCIESILDSEVKCLRASRSCHSALQYVQAYTVKLLSSVETAQTYSDTIQIGDMNSFFVAELKKLHLDYSLFKFDFKVDTPCKTANICSSLIRTILLTVSKRSSRAVMMSSRVCQWALDIFQRLWHAASGAFQLQLLQLPGLFDVYQSILKAFYAGFRSLDRSIRGVNRKASMLWAQCITDVINFVVRSDQFNPEVLLKDCADFTTELFLKIDLKQAVHDILLPALSTAMEYCKAKPTIRQYLQDYFNCVESLANPHSDTSIVTGQGVQLYPRDQDWKVAQRPAKRMRLSTEAYYKPVEENSCTQLIRRVYRLLGSQEAPDLRGLSKIAPGNFRKLSEAEQCQALEGLGLIACAGSRLLKSKMDKFVNMNMYCCICDEERGSYDQAAWEDPYAPELFQVLSTIVPLLQKSPKQRVTALLTLRRLLAHTSNSDHLRLSQSMLGEWCLHSLRSSIREARIAASITLSFYMSPLVKMPLGVLRSNCITGLDFIQSLFQRDDTAVQETCVLCLSRIAELSGDEELNIILVRLVEHLGHPNAYINALVYIEILRLAQARQTTPIVLFKPFWRTIAVVMIKNLQSRPIVIQNLCELLNMKVPSLLAMTQEHTLPYLVLTRKQEIIARIAVATGQSTTVYDVCTQKTNLACILALLLTQPSADPEETIMSTLMEIAPEFKGQELSSWVKLEPILITCELLKAMADAGEGKASKIHQALHLLSNLDSKVQSKKNDVVVRFLEEYVLAIITEFNNTLNDTRLVRPNLEKRRCLSAIGELLKIGKSRLNVALPQIGACLRSAMEHSQLCDKAFEVWIVMMSVLNEDDMGSLIDQTLAIIVQYWDNFQLDTQEQAYNLVSDILKNHTSIVRKIFNTMPSLSTIPIMSKFETEIGSLKRQMDHKHQFMAFVERCKNENSAVVEQSLTELEEHLRKNQGFIHQTALSEQPDPVVAELTRALLDVAVKFAATNTATIASLVGQCLGLIGCLDPNKIENIKEKPAITVILNFTRADEVVNFIMFAIRYVLVKAFLSASNTRSQGFLSWAIQELLKFCQGDEDGNPRGHGLRSDPFQKHWLNLPEDMRNVLQPFRTSRYNLTAANPKSKDSTYPVFRPGLTYAEWLRILTLDLLQKAKVRNAMLVFQVFSKIINGQDISIAEFMLPFTALSVIVDGTETEARQMTEEMLHILSQPLLGNHTERENIKLCSERIFNVLDYLSKWHQQRKKEYHVSKERSARGIHDTSVETAPHQLKAVEKVLSSIPPDLISTRAIECKSFARALFNWEQHIRRQSERQEDEDGTNDDLLGRLQHIYSQIDEPDGIEGISAQMQVLKVDQQVLEQKSTGQWNAAQSWYEIQLTEDPENIDLQINLLTCLKESGQYEALLNQFDGLQTIKSLQQTIPFAVEAAWCTGKWDRLARLINAASEGGKSGDFSVGIGSALLSLRAGDRKKFQSTVDELRQTISTRLTTGSTTSLQACHESLLKMHALTELERITCDDLGDRDTFSAVMDRRLNILGSYVSDKQYLLGLRRAAMQITPQFSKLDVASTWLITAKLARKSNAVNKAYSAVLNASALGDKSSTLEHAKLLWKEGHHRKAIQSLEGAIESKAFALHNSNLSGDDLSTMTLTADQQQSQNTMLAKASLLLARWLDSAGQTPQDVISNSYRQAANLHKRWEKGLYSIGKHYNKILDSERAKPAGKESQAYLFGEQAKLVIDNYLRSLAHGCKYVFQTMPKVLTLWMELLASVDQPQDSRRENKSFQNHYMSQRKKIVAETNTQLEKYLNRLQPVILYTILPQVVARICHPNDIAYSILTSMVVKVVRAFPQQAMWTLLAVIKSSDKKRASRGLEIANKVGESVSNNKSRMGVKEAPAAEIRLLVMSGQKFSDELLRVSEHPVEKRSTKVSLSRDLGFNHKIAPSKLVVPVEAALTPAFPNNTDAGAMKSFRAFPKEPVTITAFLDEASVLSSLQRPRKLTLKASDGKLYSLMAKPKDDLRKDARLMEFNTTVNRFLSKDVEAARRRLYIRTYSVVPLNEECGLLEWVENLKTFREIVFALQRERGIITNYNEIRNDLDEAVSDSGKTPNKVAAVFEKRILPKYPPVFQDWFVETFPDPSAWLAARLRYTRSCAVMSMVGHVLGLGDRHGENILLEENSGGVLHVDFNCLFDKGLTFEKPETVPFRLTQNMVSAMGVYRYDGPWRKCAEITLKLLRDHEDALMTVLETFVYDPTSEFGGKGKRQPRVVDGVEVPGTPAEVLEGVRGKVRGMLAGESVPLSVGGYVDVMAARATDPGRLGRMYIGWCAFL
ncbi:MAG: hypothetical protein Q9227_005463 [Pyrenula ochraceoflavens]